MGGHDAVGSGHQGGRRPVSADGLAAALDGLNLTYREHGRHVLVTHPTLAGASAWDVDLDKGTVADVDAPAVDVIRSGLRADRAFDAEALESILDRVGAEFGVDARSLTGADLLALYRRLRPEERKGDPRFREYRSRGSVIWRLGPVRRAAYITHR